jgi:aspartate kinase
MWLLWFAMTGITDALLASASAAEKGDESAYTAAIDGIQRRHLETTAALLDEGIARSMLEEHIAGFIQELRAYCHSIQVMGEVTPRGIDTIAPLGERLNARVFSALLSQMGVKSCAVDASGLIVTDKISPTPPRLWSYREQVQSNLLPLTEQAYPGGDWLHCHHRKRHHHPGRGGSDYTAAILGDCLDAEEVWTWTDVDGVMTADPRVVPTARVIPELSYSEVGELAYFGAKVLHPKTIRPIIERGIPLWVKNTFNPDLQGRAFPGI